MVLLKNKGRNILHISKNLDSLALVLERRLYEPNVLLTVLIRHSLFVRASAGDFSETMHEVVDLEVV